MIVTRAVARSSIAHPSQLLWRLKLLRTLVSRELAGRYQATLAGGMWPVLIQLAQLLVFTYLFASIFHVRLAIVGVTNSTLSYGLWLFVGLLTWNAMQIGTMSAAPSILSQANLVKRVVFPVALIPLVPVCAAFIESSAGLAVTGVIMPIVGAPFRESLLFLPLIYAMLLVFSSGLAYLFASITVIFRDVPQALGPLFLLAFYLTPIVYPPANVPHALRFWVDLNPMTVAIEAVRASILGLPMPPTHQLVIAATAAILTFAVGIVVFKRLRPIFADIV